MLYLILKLLNFERTFHEMCGFNPKIKVRHITSNIVKSLMHWQWTVKAVHRWKSSLHLLSA